MRANTPHFEKYFMNRAASAGCRCSPYMRCEGSDGGGAGFQTKITQCFNILKNMYAVECFSIMKTKSHFNNYELVNY